jgi:hypothetical protein
VSCHRVRTSGEDGTLGRAATRRHQQLDPTWDGWGGGSFKTSITKNNLDIRLADRQSTPHPNPPGQMRRRFGLGVVP